MLYIEAREAGEANRVDEATTGDPPLLNTFEDVSESGDVYVICCIADLFVVLSEGYSEYTYCILRSPK